MKTKFLIYFSFAILFAFFSCSEDEADAPSPNSNIVIIDYPIFEPETWYADSIYVIPNEVDIDALLTIEAGTIVKFKSESGLDVWENGTINAIGSKDASIVFTSYKDDIGGDTNGDNEGTKPNAGDWHAIDLGYQNGSQFVNCFFTFGGNDNNSGVLELGTNYSKVENCTFINNSTYVSGDEFCGALAAQDADQSTIIKNNTFYNNTVPLSINGHISIDNSNTFVNLNDTLQTNKYNGIFVHGQDILEYHTVWEETEVAYVIQYDGFEIWDNFSLTFGNNVVLKFFTNAMLDVQMGAELVNAQGTGVFFTSFKDDSLKGDTNGDGNGTTANPNDWLGIYKGSTFYTWGNILHSKNSF